MLVLSMSLYVAFCVFVRLCLFLLMLVQYGMLFGLNEIFSITCLYLTLLTENVCNFPYGKLDSCQSVVSEKKHTCS